MNWPRSVPRSPDHACTSRARQRICGPGRGDREPALRVRPVVPRRRLGRVDAARQAAAADGRSTQPADFGPSVPSPGQILCLGLNYSEHVLEGGREIPTFPDAFMRSRETVLAPYADLVRPALTERFDFEGEARHRDRCGWPVHSRGQGHATRSPGCRAERRARRVTGSEPRRSGPRARTSTAACRSARRSSPRMRSTFSTWRSRRCSTARSCSRHGHRR